MHNIKNYTQLWDDELNLTLGTLSFWHFLHSIDHLKHSHWLKHQNGNIYVSVFVLLIGIVALYRITFIYMMTSSNGNISALLALCAGNSPSPVNSPHKGQRRAALTFSLICARRYGWVNNREAGDLRRHRAHYNAIVIAFYRQFIALYQWISPVFTNHTLI